MVVSVAPRSVFHVSCFMLRASCFVIHVSSCPKFPWLARVRAYARTKGVLFFVCIVFIATKHSNEKQDAQSL